MLATSGSRGRYIALCFLILGNKKEISASSGDRRARVPVLDRYSQGSTRVNNGTKDIGYYHQEVAGDL
jgi:hypothetical protein